jgi:hypothetical protein
MAGALEKLFEKARTAVGGLVVITVFIHAVRFSVLIRAILRSHALDRWGFRPSPGW